MWIITILRILLVLVTLQSTSFFLTQLKVSVKDWLVCNACASSNILLLIGTLLSIDTLRYMAIYPMFFFGVQGLFVFPWSGIYNLIPQFSHLIMTANIITLIWEIFNLQAYQTGFQALLLAIIFITPLIYQQQQYGYRHKERLEKVLFAPMEAMMKNKK